MYYPYMYLDAYQNTADHLGDVLGYSEYENFLMFSPILSLIRHRKMTRLEDFRLAFDDNDYEQYDWYDASVGENMLRRQSSLHRMT